jgi:hypothetical protein
MAMLCGILGCGGPPKAARTATTAGADTGAVSASAELSLAGWFHVIWGDGATYQLTTEAGKSFTLLVSDELLQAQGGARALDRRRVVVVGRQAPGRADVLRLSSIKPDSTR